MSKASSTKQPLYDLFGEVPKFKFDHPEGTELHATPWRYAALMRNPEGRRLYEKYKGITILSPAGALQQARFTTATALLAMGWPEERLDAWIAHSQTKGWYRKGHLPIALDDLADAEDELVQGDMFPETVGMALPKYPKKLKSVQLDSELLAPGRNNSKLGHYVVDKQGRRIGEIYSLSWQERDPESCPISCELWNSCYGQNMGLATRWKFEVSHQALIERVLWAQLEKLQTKAFQDDRFVVVRRHALGDIPNLAHEMFWQEHVLPKLDRVRVYGYTHRLPGTDGIWEAVQQGNDRGWASNYRMYHSNNRKQVRGANTYATLEQALASGDMVCLEQRERADTCGTCTFCLPGDEFWASHSEKSVAFIEH